MTHARWRLSLLLTLMMHKEDDIAPPTIHSDIYGYYLYMLSFIFARYALFLGASGEYWVQV